MTPEPLPAGSQELRPLASHWTSSNGPKTTRILARKADRGPSPRESQPQVRPLQLQREVMLTNLLTFERERPGPATIGRSGHNAKVHMVALTQATG